MRKVSVFLFVCVTLLANSGCSSRYNANLSLKQSITRSKAEIRLDPDKPEHHYKLAKLYRKAGRDKDALDAALAASSLAQKSKQEKLKSPVYDAYAAGLLKRSGQYDQAERLYERALAELYAYAIEWNVSGMNDSISSTHMRNRIGRELSEVKQILDKDRPDEKWVWRHMPHMKIDWSSMKQKIPKAEIEDAKKQEEKLHKGEIGGDAVYDDLGRHYLHAGNPNKAIIQYLAAIQIQPEEPIYWDQLALAYLRARRLDDAAYAFEKAAKLGITDSRRFVADCRFAEKRYRSEKTGK